ncbi:DUF4252 domain-containing protein [Fulvivirga lutimaris]|uniref:DUF4252 domain-containing protein n=1 Tax=Fulvivirga lutimaris TaxID=1819566 RepID=UPI0012BC4A12|nr:DUF4252 domain-containing protein [Fulvivirga lutimaris]MTI41391.1 DUF4252 domain-containing protein [Fulvivirga lutimaris]
MKKLVVIIAMMASAVQLNAQDAISRFFEKYADDQSFTNVTITSRMFGLFTDLEMESQEDKEIMDAIGKLKGLKILAKEDISNGKSLYKEALSKLPKAEFEELMSVRDEDKDMKFMIKEKDGKIGELVMLMGGDSQFFILTIFGEIDLKQVAKISKAMDIDGLDNLNKLDKNN